MSKRKPESRQQEDATGHAHKRARTAEEAPAPNGSHAVDKLEKLRRRIEKRKDSNAKSTDVVHTATSEAHAAMQPGVSLYDQWHDQGLWRMTEPVGGQMLDIDPIVSPDEKYVLIAYLMHITVYATETSLPLRSLRMPHGRVISRIALSKSDPAQIYIATLNGQIQLWNWTSGVYMDSLKVRKSVTQLEVLKHESQDVLFFVEEGRLADETIRRLRRCQIDAANFAEGEAQDIYVSEETISSLFVHDHGKTVVLSSQRHLVIGQSEGSTTGKWTWTVLTCQDVIASIDVRFQGRAPLALPIIDVAMGTLRGRIQVYYDLISKISNHTNQNRSASLNDFAPSNLIWHRSSVLALKWSTDGNYLLSGGRETVMLMWQLDSGRKEHLPHLGSPIESIVVSPKGSSYAVRLADNSAMLLSAAQLKPYFSVAGIQVPKTSLVQQALPPLLTPEVAAALEEDSTASSSQERPLAVCTSASHPNSLLLAAPTQSSSRTWQGKYASIPYLQAVDGSSGQQLSRQALARTKISHSDNGPEGNRIEEPCVTHISVSNDGQCLASVDEWMPPTKDLSAFPTVGEPTQTRASRREVYLKFWSWNASSAQWELVARFDNPHSSDSHDSLHRDSRSVGALAADPTQPGFVTFGQEGCLKAWRPYSRRRDGMDVKTKSGQALKNWRVRYTTWLGPAGTDDSSTARGKVEAKLAWSSDGSLLALALQGQETTPIHMVDAATGAIHSVREFNYRGPLLDMALMDRYLAVLSSDLTVWDLVDDKILYGISLNLPSASTLPDLTSVCHLAADPHQGVFGIAVPQLKSGKAAGKRSRVSTSLAVFSPTTQKPQFMTTLSGFVIALLSSGSGTRGFHVLDAAANLHKVSPRFSQHSQRTGEITSDLVEQDERAAVEPSLGLAGMFGASLNGDKASTEDESSDNHLPKPPTTAQDPTASSLQNYMDKHHPVNSVYLNPDQLAAIFDRSGPSAAMLRPMEELFDEVASLCAPPSHPSN